jgi:hypothetical protein
MEARTIATVIAGLVPAIALWNAVRRPKRGARQHGRA